jgi:hypothetical protein
MKAGGSSETTGLFSVVRTVYMLVLLCSQLIWNDQALVLHERETWRLSGRNSNRGRVRMQKAENGEVPVLSFADAMKTYGKLEV